MLIFRIEIHKMLDRMINREDPDQTAPFRSSMISVCAVCFGLFSRQLVFEILEHLLYTFKPYPDINFPENFCLLCLLHISNCTKN